MRILRIVLISALFISLFGGCGGPDPRIELENLKSKHARVHTDFQAYLKQRDDLIRKLKREMAGMSKGPSKALDTAIGLLPDIPGITERDGEIIVLMTADLLFDPGKASLKSSSKAVLSQLGNALDNELFRDKAIRIEGHTDDDPIKRARKQYKSNWELGSARATAVMEYLVKYAGLDPAKRTVYTASYSKYSPISDNKGKASKARNRRVEVVIIMGRR